MPITAQGMTDALRDAELLSEEIASGLGRRQRMDQALADYECKRNAAVLSIYEFSCGLATFQLESSALRSRSHRLPEQWVHGAKELAELPNKAKHWQLSFEWI